MATAAATPTTAPATSAARRRERCRADPEPAARTGARWGRGRGGRGGRGVDGGTTGAPVVDLGFDRGGNGIPDPGRRLAAGAGQRGPRSVDTGPPLPGSRGTRPGGSRTAAASGGPPRPARTLRAGPETRGSALGPSRPHLMVERIAQPAQTPTDPALHRALRLPQHVGYLPVGVATEIGQLDRLSLRFRQRPDRVLATWPATARSQTWCSRSYPPVAVSRALRCSRPSGPSPIGADRRPARG